MGVYDISFRNDLFILLKKCEHAVARVNKLVEVNQKERISEMVYVNIRM